MVAPTDPVAVMPLLEKAGVPERIRALIGGESLFNDGAGIAAFSVLTVAVYNGASFSAGDVAWLLAREMVGGILLGSVLGLLASRLMKEAYEENAALLSLALVTGGFVLAEVVHVSAPVAVATAGIVRAVMMLRLEHKVAAGHVTKSEGHADVSRSLMGFWHIIDQVLNAVLFALLALEVLVIPINPLLIPVGIGVALVTILARGLGIWSMVTLYEWQNYRRWEGLGQRWPWRPFPPYTRRLMTWAGLRGAVALALALAFSLLPGDLRDTLLLLTYVVVLFSLLVQGLTIPALGAKLVAADAELGGPETMPSQEQLSQWVRAHRRERARIRAEQK